MIETWNIEWISEEIYWHSSVLRESGGISPFFGNANVSFQSFYSFIMYPQRVGKVHQLNVTCLNSFWLSGHINYLVFQISLRLRNLLWCLWHGWTRVGLHLVEKGLRIWNSRINSCGTSSNSHRNLNHIFALVIHVIVVEWCVSVEPILSFASHD